jgi:hypothetical protein
MDGGDRAGYMQISKNTQATIITSTGYPLAVTGDTSYTSGDWCGFEVISSGAAIAGIVAPGITGSSLITSATTYPLGTYIGGRQITAIKISTKSTGHKVMAYERVLL